MEERRREQDYKDKKEKRRLVRVMKNKFKIKDGSSSEEFAKRIVKMFFGKIDLGWEYYRMVAWAEENKAKPSLPRFANWLKRLETWEKEKKAREPDKIDLDDKERQQSKRILQQYGRHKRVPNSNE